jgi:3-oxoadipate enol-lactonase
MLVLVHGAGCDHHVFDALRAALSDDVIAIDLPGRGDSRPPCTTAAEAARAVVADVARRGLRLEDAIVVGHSYGGAVAIECALSSSPAGLVLISTGARLRVRPELLAANPRESALVSAETATADWRAADAFDRMTDVERIAVPTLVIGGEHDDRTPPKYARYLAAKIPGAQLQLLGAAGHMCIVDDVPRVADAIEAFRRSITAR